MLNPPIHHPWSDSPSRPRPDGKLLSRGGEPFFVRGVTYGTFRPLSDGHEYPDRLAVEKDFATMVAHGINAVRTYTVPPSWLLEAAEGHGLQVMVGLPMERYVGYLTDRKGAPNLFEIVRDSVRPVAGHPAILCYSLANEIPAASVRWLGRRKMEAFLARLCDATREADPEGLVTYVSYPTTEYLDLPFLDIASYNVYLEEQTKLEAYLDRLHNLAGGRPLLLAEVGLDGLRNGEAAQARSIDWQLRTAFASGCAGAFVYSWTDEWHRGGEDVHDWEFGITRRDRRAKEALASVSRVYSEVPFPPERQWPRFSVVVCSYNGSRTIRECLQGATEIDYPNYEVIVVDDGSTDDTAQIASEFDVRLIRTPQRGLSNARNTGMEAASGEFIAYIDDDAWPDRHWLTYLAEVFTKTGCAAAGGPNVSPPDDGFLASCVNDAPGNPTHVLLSDREAEHLPGCNLAIRRESLRSIGGFDPSFRTAGDDVDVCWRLRDQGGSLGFHPAALVWHHRRGKLATYWRQQRGYGASEALLESKWPERYSGTGHVSWGGRVYGGVPLLGRTRIYQGVWGSAPFQSVYGPFERSFFAYALTPDWYLAVVALFGLALLGFSWPPLWAAAPVAGCLAGVSLLRAGILAARASGMRAERSRLRRLRRWVVTGFLHLVQPIARTQGRLRHGLTPWRASPRQGAERARAGHLALWSETWEEPAQRLQALESELRRSRAAVVRGGPYDHFDLEVRRGALGASRILMAVEEHGGGCQLVRIRIWRRVGLGAAGLAASLALLAIGAAGAQAWLAVSALTFCSFALLVRIASDCGTALRAARRATSDYAESNRLRPVSRPDDAR